MQSSGLALLVEDNPPAIEWLGNCLAEAFPAYRLLRAATYTEAANLLKQHQFNLALIDLRLPDDNGMDLIRTLRG
jgi:CheY-like chemotaxis protein